MIPTMTERDLVLKKTLRLGWTIYIRPRTGISCWRVGDERFYELERISGHPDLKHAGPIITESNRAEEVHENLIIQDEDEGKDDNEYM